MDGYRELADLLREHFGTLVRRGYGGPADVPPNRLVYLLEHEYTQRGLNWQRLKGADASRVTLLRAAIDKVGCEAVLALADVHTTHGAFEDDYRDRFGRRWRYDEDDEEDAGDGSRYEIQDLIDSAVALTHWTRPDSTGLEEVSLSVDGTEVCASTSSGDLEPYASEYEGYRRRHTGTG